MIETNTLAELRTRLETDLLELTEQLQRLGRQLQDGDWIAVPPVLDETEEDPNFQSDRIEEYENNLADFTVLEERFHDVSDALVKMDNGTYGICEESGEPISIERLQANPSARTAL